MSKLPGGVQVDRALKNVSREVRSSLNRINSNAGKLLEKGDYTGAEGMVEKAKVVGEFQDTIENLRAQWKEMRGSVRSPAPKERTPLWEYYRPILQALIANGGNANATDIEPVVEQAMGEKLKPGDRDALGDGKPRWKVMIKRARRHMAKEGWIEANAGPEWRITKEGQIAADPGSS